MKNILFSLFVGAVFVILVHANEKYDCRPNIQIQQKAIQGKNSRYMIILYVKKGPDGTYVRTDEEDPYAIRVNLNLVYLKPGTKSITIKIQD